MIYLASKAPGDVVDYNLDMSEFVPAGFSIDTLSMAITDAGNTESPITLVVEDSFTQPLDHDDTGGFSLAVVFWLAGGTPGVRYQGTITMSDNQGMDPDRTYVRLFQVEVEPL